LENGKLFFDAVPFLDLMDNLLLVKVASYHRLGVILTTEFCSALVLSQNQDYIVLYAPRILQHNSVNCANYSEKSMANANVIDVPR